MSSRNVTKQLESTLQNLLPAYSSASFLPAPLVELATTLLLQSQSRAAHLKPEEEPARYSAVCEIACQRLKTRLNLPKIESRPPCPPRTYKKLYQFLDRTLTTTTPATAAGRSAAGNQENLRLGKESGSGGAALKTSSGVPASTNKRAMSKVQGLKAAKSQLLTPESTSAPAPHKRRRINASEAQDDTLMTDDVAPTAAEMAETAPSGSWRTPQDLADGAAPDRAMVQEEDEDESDAESAPRDESAQQIGVGSLMQSRFDWLSEDRTADFARWKSKMMRRIEAADGRRSIRKSLVR